MHRLRFQLVSRRLLIITLPPYVEIYHEAAEPIPPSWLHAVRGHRDPRVTTAHRLVDVSNTEIQLGDGVLYLAAKACERARASTSTVTSVLRRHPLVVSYRRPWRARRRGDHLAATIERQGIVYWLVRGAGGSLRCERWRFRPGKSLRAGALFRRVGRRDRVSYGYHYDGRVIRLYGPRSEYWEHGKQRSIAVLCMSTLAIRQMSSRQVHLDGSLGVPSVWHLSRQACRSAPNRAKRAHHSRAADSGLHPFANLGLAPRICGSS